MAAQFLDALESEIAELERELEDDPRFVKLRELRRIRGLYATDTAHQFVRAAQTVGGLVRAARASRNKEKANAAAAYLADRNSPVPTAEILQGLLAEGVEIGGQEPRNTLSAILSHSDLFVSRGRAGWLLRSKLEPPKGLLEIEFGEDEAEQPPKRQNDETPSGYQPLGASESDEEDDVSDLA